MIGEEINTRSSRRKAHIPDTCQLGSDHQVRPEETGAHSEKMRHLDLPETRMEFWSPGMYYRANLVTLRW